MSSEIEKLMRFASKEAYLNLSKLLKVPYDDSMQDWKWEVARHVNFNECLILYLNTSSEDECLILMEILIQSIANQIADGLNPDESENWRQIQSLIHTNPKLHAYSVYYWSGFDENHEWYPLAKSMQAIWLNIENAV